jgi:hypothetical protein
LNTRLYMKPKRILVLDLSALARPASGSPELEDDDARDPAPSRARWARCGTAIDHQTQNTQARDVPIERTPDPDSDPLAIDIALEWVRDKRDRTRRSAFERTLLRTLQARLRRNGLRAARRPAPPREPGPSRRRG